MLKIGCLLIFWFVFVKFGICLIDSPGAQIHISANGLNKAIQSAIKVVHENPGKIKIPDQAKKKIHPKHWVPLWVSVFNQYVKSINIDSGSTRIELTQDNNIKIHIGYVDVQARGRVRVHQSHWPPWTVSRFIDCHLTINYIEIIVNVLNKNGQPVVNVLQAHVDVNNVNCKLSGDIIVKTIGEAILKNMNIKKLVQDAMDTNIRNAVLSFTKNIDKIPMETEMHGLSKNFYINYMLTRDPWAANNDFIVPIISQFWYKGHRDDNPPTIKPSGPFPQYKASRDVCLDADSNLMFSSAAYAFNVSDQSKMGIADDVFKRLKPSLQPFFSCDCTGLLCFTTFFKELKKECRPGGKVKINVVAKLQAGVHFNNTGAYILASAQSSFIAEAADGDEENPITLMELDAEVGVHLSSKAKIEKWVVYGKVDVFYTNLTAKSPYMGDIPLSLLDQFWEAVLKEIATLIANDLIGSGMPLPPVDFVTFSNSHISFNGPFMQLCTDVQVDFSKLFPTHRRKHKHRKVSQTQYVYVPVYIPVHL